jgi:hypothetical protein
MSSSPVDNVIDLNVGGVHYSTTVRTLTSDPDSLLAKMFNPKTVAADGSGGNGDTVTRQHGERVFIDRDGPLFRFVLDYLRNGCRLVLPDVFHERERLRQEAEFYRLPGLVRCLHIQAMIPTVAAVNTGRRSPSPGLLVPAASPMDGSGGQSPRSDVFDRRFSGTLQQQPYGEAGCIIVGYRGTFAFGRDGGVADVKFRKLWRILVSGRVALCKEVFGETLNDSRDPDRGDGDRYSARFFLKHTFLEQAFDALLDAGFRMVGACGSGTNSAGDVKPGMDTEESKWNHYNEFVFTRP